MLTLALNAIMPLPYMVDSIFQNSHSIRTFHQNPLPTYCVLKFIDPCFAINFAPKNCKKTTISLRCIDSRILWLKCDNLHPNRRTIS